MKVSVVSLGCRTNQAEILRIESDLSQAGHQIVPLSSSPDICIVNTCAVTSRAESDSRRLIRNALEKSARVMATGCFVELNFKGLSTSGLERFMPVRNEQKDFIPGIIGYDTSCALSSPQPIIRRHRPVVKAQDGCDARCSYCVVPSARGKSRSIPVGEVINRVNYYHSLGAQEIVLSGIHLGSYGKDHSPPISLGALLKEMLRQTAVPRIRLSSVECGEIDDELLEVLLEQRLCRHLHVPLQSGDDAILESMNRHYTAKAYVALMERLLSLSSEVALGTDVMVGFPGEGSAQYARTLKVVKALPFAYLHVFPYSPRPDTPAASFTPTVSETDRKIRVEELREISSTMKKHFACRNAGHRLQALVETVRRAGCLCTTGNYIKALVSSPEPLIPGTLVNVTITGWESGLAKAIVAP